MAIIKSILDDDLYKHTMMTAILSYRQNVPVRYAFNNRRPEGKFNELFMAAFREELDAMRALRLTPDEAKWLCEAVPFLGNDYIEYLRNYRYDPSEVTASLEDGELALDIKGPWERTIYWEVKLMAICSQLYFTYCDTDWEYCEASQVRQIRDKAKILEGYPYADFGTRRRRNYTTQDTIVGALVGQPGFVGTSNVHLAHKYGVKPIGTMAHEWIQGIAALESLRYANRYALKIWGKVFNGRLGTALTDTFGTDAFFQDFDGYLARLFDGVRHDSGDPYRFIEQTVAHYQKLGIDPRTKTIIFSDSLNPKLAGEIAVTCQGRIKFSFGIGTNFTNDFCCKSDPKQSSKALNMVIKMQECNGLPVVKLSDTPTKAIGDPDALRVARWTFFQTPLDGFCKVV